MKILKYIPGKRLQAIYVILYSRLFSINAVISKDKKHWVTNFFIHNAKYKKDLADLDLCGVKEKQHIEFLKNPVETEILDDIEYIKVRCKVGITGIGAGEAIIWLSKIELQKLKAL